MIRKAYEDGLLTHPIENGAPLPVLQYADDTLLILRGSIQQATFAKSILDAFALFTGLTIKFQKSTFVPLHMTQQDSVQVASIFGCTPSTLPCTYLGLPLSMSKNLRTMLQPVIQRVDSRLPGWMPRMLGSGARI
jgi:hypothetical protein